MVMIVMGNWVHYLMKMKKRVNSNLTMVKYQYTNLCQRKKTKTNRLQLLLFMKYLAMFQLRMQC